MRRTASFYIRHPHRRVLIAALGGLLLEWGSARAGEERDANPQPATVARTMSVLDLSSIAKLNAGQIMDESPTSLMYVSRSSLPAAMAYYQAELASRGWNELKPTT